MCVCVCDASQLQVIGMISCRSEPLSFFYLDGCPDSSAMTLTPLDRFPPSKTGYSCCFWLKVDRFLDSEPSLFLWRDAKGQVTCEVLFKPHGYQDGERVWCLAVLLHEVELRFQDYLFGRKFEYVFCALSPLLFFSFPFPLLFFSFPFPLLFFSFPFPLLFFSFPFLLFFFSFLSLDAHCIIWGSSAAVATRHAIYWLIGPFSFFLILFASRIASHRIAAGITSPSCTTRSPFLCSSTVASSRFCLCLRLQVRCAVSSSFLFVVFLIFFFFLPNTTRINHILCVHECDCALSPLYPSPGFYSLLLCWRLLRVQPTPSTPARAVR